MAPRRRLILADASALVGALDQRDGNHEHAARVLRTIRGAELLTTCAAFAEAGEPPGLGWPPSVMGARRTRGPARRARGT